LGYWPWALDRPKRGTRYQTRHVDSPRLIPRAASGVGVGAELGVRGWVPGSVPSRAYGAAEPGARSAAPSCGQLRALATAVHRSA